MGRSDERRSRLSHRGERGAALVALALAALVVLAVTLLGACSESAPGGSPSPSSVGDAFRAAHPSGAVPPGLKRGGDASRAAELFAARVAADRILLPGWLPPDYGLAAPYVGIGSGVALPNPFIWDGGYRVSYSDGRGLILLHVGSGRLPGEGAWQALARTWRGTTLRMRVANGLTTVASRAGARPVAVAVAGVPAPRETAVRVLRSLRR